MLLLSVQRLVFRAIFLAIILVGGLVHPHNSFGIVDPPLLLRACLNTNDSIVTIEYLNPTDACGSFLEYKIYGKDVGPTYTLLGTQNNFSATSVQIKLPNTNPTWSFVFDVHFLCNGSDIVRSLPIFVDSNKPTLLEIDSVSVDVSTQNIIVGWSKNSSPDVKGYRIYKNSSGINSTLGESNTLTYTVTSQPSNQPISLTLAAFDSCNLFSPISPSHSPMILNGTYDLCSSSFTLTWSSYVGWPTENFSLFSSLNNSPYQTVNKNIASTTNSMTVQTKANDSTCFYVRAENQLNSNITSSSTRWCFKTPNPITPENLYLSYASVTSDDNIEIQCIIEDYGTTDSLVIYRKNAGDLTPIKSFQTTNGSNSYSAIDNVNPNLNSYTYVAKSFAPCIGETGISNEAKTIFLQIDNTQQILSWSPYLNWEGGVDEYELWGFDGSTWNIISTTSFLQETVDTIYTCFKIIGKQGVNDLGYLETSTSNSICVQKKPTFYVPNALSTGGANHTFKVIGTSLDFENSSFIIFDRWGGLVYETNRVDIGWNIEQEGADVPVGVYFYVLTLRDLSGNKHKDSGSIRVIR